MTDIITLTTDFGLADEYVGVLKGVILGRAPRVRIVDISHDIPGQDIRRAAAMLSASYPYFPRGTIHLVVVDPGVGSARRIILVAADGHFFLAPDNGILTAMLAPALFEAAFAVNCRELFLQPVSNTFHGRDIMAPVAAALASGIQPTEVGPPLDCQKIVRLPEATVETDSIAGTITGSVTSVDHFGNLRTNISLSDFMGLCAGSGIDPENPAVSITIKDHTIHGLKSSYSATPPGGLLALFGSRNCLEIAANMAEAARILNAGIGNTVVVSLAQGT